MFGHQNDQNNQNDDNQSMEQGINAIVNNDVTPVQPPQSFTPPASDNLQDAMQAPVYTDPVDDDTPPVQESTIIQPTNNDTAAVMPTSAPLDTNGLLDIKQQALTQLSPLVGHLEQTPEEKFRTTMMMIQASDNQSLIKDAYESAQRISDEKNRAQALLDVINEINYFTQHNKA
jgi:hypothetical protein